MKSSENKVDKNANTGSHAKKLFDLTYDEAFQCVQCGYCLPACPTYASMGKETASPRGRIHLVKLAAEGKIDIGAHLAGPIDLCLGCRACEVACPVGVPYGHILESAKEVIADAQHSDQSTNKIKTAALKQLFPYPQRLRLLGNMIWLYQKTGLDKLLRKTKVLHKITEPMAAFEKVLAPVEAPAKRHRPGAVIPAKGHKKSAVAFFSGCIMDALMNRTNRLSIELLTRIGCEVVIPKQQRCCGALHIHQGLKEQAKQLAKANIEAFEQSGADYYVNNAGGCGAMLGEYDQLFSGDADWIKRAESFVSKSRDITQILVQYGPLPFTGSWDGVITYQDSCHLRNVQGVSEEPRLLLRSIPGARFVELEGSDQCCASGGIYNIVHYEESMKILDNKMDRVNDTRATIIVTTNPGCLLQMRLGIERKGNVSSMQAVHLVEVLAEACGLG